MKACDCRPWAGGIGGGMWVAEPWYWVVEDPAARVEDTKERVAGGAWAGALGGGMRAAAADATDKYLKGFV